MPVKGGHSADRGKLAALRKHHVEVKLLAEVFVQLDRFGIKANRPRRHVIRADHGRVAGRVGRRPAVVAELEVLFSADVEVERAPSP